MEKQKQSLVASLVSVLCNFSDGSYFNPQSETVIKPLIVNSMRGLMKDGFRGFEKGGDCSFDKLVIVK